ncbi:MAG TPA: hypothetical protein VKA60_21405 [Blastocatellia bacterium]|nr:hypothetical protein [Blastocatellia bacterium]
MQSYCKAALCLLLLASPALTQMPGQRSAPSLTTEEAIERRNPPPQIIDGRAVTRVTVTRERGRNGARERLVFTPADGRFKATVEDRTRDGLPDYVTIEFHGQNNWWRFEFTTYGLGINMAPGSYVNCQRAAFSEGTAGLDIGANHSGCNTLTGSFTIYDVRFDYSKGRPELASFAASFEQQCGIDVQGMLYFNAVPKDETH